MTFYDVFNNIHPEIFSHKSLLLFFLQCGPILRLPAMNLFKSATSFYKESVQDRFRLRPARKRVLQIYITSDQCIQFLQLRHSFYMKVVDLSDELLLQVIKLFFPATSPFEVEMLNYFNLSL